MPKTELEVLEEISSKQDITSKEVKEVKEAAEAVKKENLEMKTQVTDLNALLETKGALIVDIQGEIKELKAKSGRMKGQAPQPVSVNQMIEDTIVENKAAISEFKGGTTEMKIETKAVGPILSANLTGTGNNYVSYLDWRPGMEPLGQFHFRDLVRTIQSETDFVRFPRANTPIGEGSFGRTAEGVTKPQIDRDYTMIDLTLTALAGFTIVSRQSLRNIVFLQSWLPTSLMEQLRDTEDLDFANALVAAATGSTTVPTGYTGAPEQFVAFVASLIAAKYRPNAIVCDPAVWGRLLIFQPGRVTAPVAGVPYSNPLIMSVDQTGTVRVLGIPVYPVNWLTGGRVLVGDWSKAAIVQSEGMVMRQSDSHASIFTSNEIAFLLEVTNGLAIFRPNAFTTAVLS